MKGFIKIAARYPLPLGMIAADFNRAAQSGATGEELEAAAERLLERWTAHAYTWEDLRKEEHMNRLFLQLGRARGTTQAIMRYQDALCRLQCIVGPEEGQRIFMLAGSSHEHPTLLSVEQITEAALWGADFTECHTITEVLLKAHQSEAERQLIKTSFSEWFTKKYTGPLGWLRRMGDALAHLANIIKRRWSHGRR